MSPDIYDSQATRAAADLGWVIYHELNQGNTQLLTAVQGIGDSFSSAYHTFDHYFKESDPDMWKPISRFGGQEVDWATRNDSAIPGIVTTVTGSYYVDDERFERVIGVALNNNDAKRLGNNWKAKMALLGFANTFVFYNKGRLNEDLDLGEWVQTDYAKAKELTQQGVL